MNTKPPQQKKPLPVVNPYEQALERRQKKEVLRPKPPTSEKIVDRLVINFTRLPEKLIEAALQGAMNYTPLETEQEDEAAKIAAVRRQLQYLRGEENAARSHFKNKAETKQQEEVQAEQQEAQAEKERLAAEQQQMEPTSKQARGSLFGGKKKKVQKTIENKASQGKN